MVYVKKILVGACLLSLAGCSTFSFKDKTFEEGYRAGAGENMRDFAQNFYGNDFPYFYWQSPIVQNVRIPAHIENGVFIPDHNEPVMIEPGEWRKHFTYPIKSRSKNKEKEEENYAISNVDFGVNDITVLPQSFACGFSSREDKDTR